MPLPEQDRDVLPPIANHGMALLWLLLFGGRGLIIPFLQIVGLVQPQQVTEWDDGLFLRLYLVLFSITVLVVALRAARRPRAASQPPQEPDAIVASSGSQIRQENKARD